MMIADPQRRAAPMSFAALLLANAALVSGPLLVRMADVGPVAAAFWRLTLALPFITAMAWWFGRRAAPQAAGTATPPTRNAIVFAVAGGVFLAVDLASWHAGILLTKMTHATLFGNAASLILAVGALVVMRRWPVKGESAAILLAFGGAGLLMSESSAQGEARLIGDLLCLLAGVLYAGYVVTMQRARRAMGSWSSLAWATAAGVLPLLCIAIAMGETIWPGDWRPVLLLALMSQVIGQGLLIYALPHFSGLVIGLSLLTQPALAALVGWLAFGERLTPFEWIGGAMLAAALVLIRVFDPAAPATGKAS